MKLKAPKFEIPSDDPFRYDRLGRKKSAEALTELIKSTDEPLVLCIDSPWGTGKTTFVTMWRQMLNVEGVRTIYFNAWENDFADDAFVALIGELEVGISEFELDDDHRSRVQKHLDAAKRIGAGIVRRSLPAALKIASAGLLDLEEMTEETIAEYVEKFAEEKIGQYESSKKSVSGFKEQLEYVATEAYSNVEENRRYPLVIIIDELDRCRPSHSVRVLEAVKHFFSVKNVVFVLAIDRTQLGHAIRGAYGAGIDVSGYLRRFIDLDYNLPRVDKDDFVGSQFDRFGLKEIFAKRVGSETRYDMSNFREVFKDLFGSLDLTLREQEHAFTMLSLAIRTTPENFLLYPMLLSALIVLKIKNQDLYRDFVFGDASVEEVIAYIGKSRRGSDFINSNPGAYLEAMLACCRESRPRSRDVREHYAELAKNAVDQDIRQRAERISAILNDLSMRDAFGLLNYLVQKIDLASHFRG